MDLEIEVRRIVSVVGQSTDRFVGRANALIETLEKQTEAMERSSKSLTRATWVLAVWTAVMAVATACTLWLAYFPID